VRGAQGLTRASKYELGKGGTNKQKPKKDLSLPRIEKTKQLAYRSGRNILGKRGDRKKKSVGKKRNRAGGGNGQLVRRGIEDQLQELHFPHVALCPP